MSFSLPRSRQSNRNGTGNDLMSAGALLCAAVLLMATTTVAASAFLPTNTMIQQHHLPPIKQHSITFFATADENDAELREVSRRRRTSRSSTSSAGPKASSSRAHRQRPSRSNASNTTINRRAPHQFDHTKETAWSKADTLNEIQKQQPNEDAPVLEILEDNHAQAGPKIDHAHYETRSLDDLFPNLGFSSLFCQNGDFRNAIRNAMREDVFHTTPAYAGLSEKARRMLLLPDSSLQGSWRCRKEEGTSELRMTRLTQVLQQYLGSNAPTGDDFMETIGVCGGSTPQQNTHWIDIVGLQNRRVPHSWHQDTGGSDGDSKTVLLGFPAPNNYSGVGVFSHLVKLANKRVALPNHPDGQPVLYPDVIDDTYIVGPLFAEGREIILYRDVDVLHSAPDIAFRTSVMRFM